MSATARPGMAAWNASSRPPRTPGALSIADAKRGDIGSTMAAYRGCVAAGRLGPGRGITEPVPGLRASRPAAEAGGGVFVLALDPRGLRAARRRGRPADCRAAAAETRRNGVDQTPRTSVGLVVGATVGSALMGPRRIGAVAARSWHGPGRSGRHGGRPAAHLRGADGPAPGHLEHPRAARSQDLQDAARRTLEELRAA